MGLDKITVGYEGKEAEFETPEGRELLHEAVSSAVDNVRTLRNGQSILPGTESELLDNTTLIRNRVRELLNDLDMADAEVSVAVKMPGEAFVNGVHMDVTTSISVKMKPQKQEEGG